MVALSASRLVWLAMLWISVTTSPILWVPAASLWRSVLVRRASSAAVAAMWAERVACWERLWIEAVGPWVAAAMAPTLVEPCGEALPAYEGGIALGALILL